MVDLLKLPAATLALCLALAACGHGGEGPRTEPATRAEATPGEAGGTARGPDPPAPREISTDTALSRDPGAGTPARESSLRVVEEGKGYLIAGQATEAERRFATATRIDPTNGFAYYWLGRARVEEGNVPGAVGVLEKAESLLGPYPAWRDRARSLLDDLR